MKPVVEELLAEYNSKKKPMNLVFFDDAIEHLTRIHRILRLQQVTRSCNCNNVTPLLHHQQRHRLAAVLSLSDISADSTSDLCMSRDIEQNLHDWAACVGKCPAGWCWWLWQAEFGKAGGFHVGL